MLVLLVDSVATSLTAAYVAGLLFGVAAVAAKFSPRSRISYALMVPTTACLPAFAMPQVEQLSEQRVIDNLVGGALVFVASAAAIGYLHWEAGRGNVTMDESVITGSIAQVSPSA